MKLKTAKKLRALFKKFETIFGEDKSTAFLLEITADKANNLMKTDRFDCSDVADALIMTVELKPK